MSAVGTTAHFPAESRDAELPVSGDARTAIPFWETGLIVLAFFLSTNALFPLIFSEDLGTSTSIANDPITRRAWILIFLFAIAAVVHRRGQVFTAVRLNPALALICYLALASAIWSDTPGATFQYAIELALTTLLGIYIGVRFGVQRIVAMLSWTTAAILVLSVLFAVALPKYGIDHERGGSWRGVFTTKNELGRLMVIGLIVWLVRLKAGETGRLRGVALVVGFAVVGVEAGSRTALGVAGMMMGVFVLVWLLRRFDRSFIPVKGLVVSLLALVAVLVATNVKLLLGSVGSDYSLTGRAGIWRAVWHSIEVHPWLGYGFDAFWRGTKGPSLAVWQAAGTPTPHSHNGYLDLVLALGFVGLAAFLISLVVTWRRGLMQLRISEGSARTFPLVYLSLLVLYNLTESSLVSRRSIEWIIYVALAAAVTSAASAPSPVEPRRRARLARAVPLSASRP